MTHLLIRKSYLKEQRGDKEMNVDLTAIVQAVLKTVNMHSGPR
jgi:hypothetical protein